MTLALGLFPQWIWLGLGWPVDRLSWSALPWLGEMAALSAAALWALSTVVYGRLGQVVPPLQLNLAKGAVAIGLLIITVALRALPLPAADPIPLVLLLLSGVIGIGLGDSCLFQAINRLGTRRALLLGAFSPSLSALFGLVFLGEQLAGKSWLGIGLTIAGISWVIAERTPSPSAPVTSAVPPISLAHGKAVHGSQVRWGLVYGVIACCSHAAGATLSRAALAETTIEPLWSSLLRLVAGEIALVAWLLISLRQSGFPYRQGGWAVHLRAKSGGKAMKLVGAIVISALGGTYLGIWLQQIALKYTEVGIAQALLATSPLFVLPIVAWLGEPISLRAILGVMVALAGVVLLFR